LAILKGPMTVRRYRVNGEAPEGFRMKYSDALEAHSFRDPASLTHREEVVGWVETENMLYQNFADINRWLWEPYAMFSLRMDKKVLPVKWVRALQDQRVREWCENQGQKIAPSSVKRDIKDAVETELLTKTLPRVQLIEVCWNVAEGWLLFNSQSVRVNDVFRKRFHATFGLELHAQHPLEWLPENLATQLEGVGATDFKRRESHVS
jgi:DNA recombination-dependent growth factor C